MPEKKTEKLKCCDLIHEFYTCLMGDEDNIAYCDTYFSIPKRCFKKEEK